MAIWMTRVHEPLFMRNQRCGNFSTQHSMGCSLPLHLPHRYRVSAQATPLTSSPATDSSLYCFISRSLNPISRLSPSSSSSSSSSSSIGSFKCSSQETKLHSSFLRFAPSRSSSTLPLFICYATNSPSPDSDPPPGKQQQLAPTADLEATLNRVQDKVQIFFAVLFWMSLFFWSCAWDGGDDGRSNKGPRFRK